jgi:flavin-dependent dehydrogenase
MAAFDYDVVILGSGFGGSVAALRAAEKGYRVGVMESGRRHGSRFDVPTGAVVAGPAIEALTVYEGREVDGTIQVRA